MLQPLSNNVVITPTPKDKISAGGIVIPDVVDNRKPLSPGRVIAAGPNVESEGVVGRMVLYATGAGTPLPDEGAIYLVMSEEAVYAILPEYVTS